MNDNAHALQSERQDLLESLRFLEQLRDAGLMVVPTAPTQAMLQAGAEAGGIDVNMAARVFHAMLTAEDDAPNSSPFGLIVG